MFGRDKENEEITSKLKTSTRKMQVVSQRRAEPYAIKDVPLLLQ